MLVVALAMGELSRPFSYSITINGTVYEAGPVLARERAGTKTCYVPFFLVPGYADCAET